MRLYCLVIFLLLCLSSVYGAEEILVEQVPQSVLFSKLDVSFQNTISSAQACTTHTDYIQLSNNGFSPLYVALDDTSTWVTLGQVGVSIDPGEQVTIPAFITIPCDFEGRHSFTYKIGSGDEQRVFERELTVDIVSNIQVTIEDPIVNVCPCEGDTVSFSITNTGPVVDTYKIKSELSVVPDTIILFPGQTHSGNVFVVADCKDYGRTNIPFTVESSTHVAKSVIVHNINACFNYAVTSQPVTSCTYQPTTIDFTVNHLDKTPNSIMLDLGVVPFLEASKTTVDFQTQGQKNISFIGVPTKPFNKTLDVETKGYAGFSSNLAVPVDIQACYDYEFTLPEKKVASCEIAQELPLLVTNNGDNATLELFAEPSLVFSDPILNVPSDTTVLTTVTIPPNFSFSKADIFIGSEQAPYLLKAQTLHFYNEDNCLQLDVNPLRLHLSAGQQNHTLYVKNSAYGAQEYELSLNSTIAEIINDSAVLVNHDQFPIILQTFVDNQTPYQVYDAQLFAQFNNTIQIIPIRLSYSSGLNPLHIFLGILILLLLILFVLLLLLVRKKKPADKSFQQEIKAAYTKKSSKKGKTITKKITKPAKKTSDKKPFPWWIILLLIILLLIGFGSYLAYEQTPINQTQTNQTNQSWFGNWFENLMNQSINVSEFLPDNMSNHSIIAPPIEDNETETINQTQVNFTTNETLGDEDIVLDRIDWNVSINWTQYTKPLSDVRRSLGSWWSGLFNKTPESEQVIRLNSSNFAELWNQSYQQVLEEKKPKPTMWERIVQAFAIPPTNATQQSVKEDPVLDTLQYVHTNYSGSYIVVPSGTTRSINLSKFFIDPDEDKLNFTVAVDDVQYQLEDSILSLQAPEDAYDVQNITITATDSNGEVTVSPPILVILGPREVVDAYTKSRTLLYVVVGIIVLVVFIAILIFDFLFLKNKLRP